MQSYDEYGILQVMSTPFPPKSMRAAPDSEEKLKGLDRLLRWILFQIKVFSIFQWLSVLMFKAKKRGLILLGSSQGGLIRRIKRVVGNVRE